MAVYYNLKGTTQPFFQIGKGGTTLYQGASDPTGSYTVNNGDYWLDTSGRIRVRLSNAWVPATLNVMTADSPPSTPSDGDLWWDSTNLTLMVYYDDGTSSQWVNATPGIQGAPGIQGTTGIQGTQGIQGIQGIQSIQGIQGIQGATGSIGTVGLTDLSDVTISGAGTGDMLYKSAGDWVNTAKVRWDNTNSYLTISATQPWLRMFDTLATDPADNGYLAYQADSFQLGFRDASVPTVFVMMRLNQDKTAEFGPGPSFKIYDASAAFFTEVARVETGKLGLAASSTSYAQLRLWTGGSAPSSPYDGDMWSTTGGLYYRDGSTTKNLTAPRALYNASTSSQGAGFATDTYLTGSEILIPNPSTLLKAGTMYRVVFTATKTAAGTATPIINIRYGTAASTADTSRGTLTFTAGSAAVDDARFEVYCTFRSVGSGTSAVLQSACTITHRLDITGFISIGSETEVATSGGFDSTPANSYLGVSVNGGTSASWTVTQVQAELVNLEIAP